MLHTRFTLVTSHCRDRLDRVVNEAVRVHPGRRVCEALTVLPVNPVCR